MMKRILAFAALLAACSDSTGPSNDTITLELTSIDGRTLPVNLASGANQVTITSGTLKGSEAGPACSYSISQQNVASAAFGSVSSCTITKNQVIVVTLNLGGPPWPSGDHSYHFE